MMVKILIWYCKKRRLRVKKKKSQSIFRLWPLCMYCFTYIVYDHIQRSERQANKQEWIMRILFLVCVLVKTSMVSRWKEALARPRQPDVWWAELPCHSRSGVLFWFKSGVKERKYHTKESGYRWYLRCVIPAVPKDVSPQAISSSPHKRGERYF